MELIGSRRIDEDTVEYTYSDDDGGLLISRKYDTTNAMKSIQHNREFAPRGKDLYHVASLPLELIEHWRLTEGFDWFTASDAEKKAKLNDPDNSAFRVMECNV